MGKSIYYPEYKRAYYINNREKALDFSKSSYKKDPVAKRLYARKQRLRSKYFPNLSIEEAWTRYNQMLLNQNNLCAICGKPETKRDHQLQKVCTLAVDHCHKTNRVRSLLCFRCNTNLGWFEKMFEDFSTYLRKFE
jgi:hypothetical protein